MATNLIKFFTTFVLIFLMGCANSNLLPNGAAQRGTLTNPKLQIGMMIELISRVSTLGCNQMEFQAFVSEMPVGSAGSRKWKELWIAQGCEIEYPISINFQEDGTEAVNWFIE